MIERIGGRACLAAGATLVCRLLLGAGTAMAQTQTGVGVPAKGHGSATLSLQRVRLGGEFEAAGEFTHRSLLLELDYGLTDRIALTAWLPYKSNRYIGNRPHNPAQLLNPHGETLRDDGLYHSGWADWGLGLRWLWRTEPVAIAPFMSFHNRINDYPIYSIAAFGTQQWRLDLGANAGGRLPGWVRNLYWQLGYAYSRMEKTRPSDAPARRVNHSIVNAELGWLATPELSFSLNWRYRKTHDGLRPPQDFNFRFNTDLWYHHDQLFPLEQSVATLGMSYRLNDRHTLHASFGRSLDVDFGADIKDAYALGFTRSF